MDLILRICDDLFFDKLWSHLVPLSAFSPSPDSLVSLNGSAIIDIPVVDSKWSQLVSYLPHPPLPPHELPPSILSYSSSISPAHAPRLASAWPRDYIPRQVLSLFAMTSIGITILYFTFAWLSYKFIFNHDMMRHPRFLKNQIKLEIQCSLRAFPGMILLTLPWFQAEVMGYSKLYDDVEQYGWFYLFASVPFFLLFTDYGIYWVHRWLHHPVLYKTFHKPHHKWIIPTPFSSHAFHPVDGYLQSVPYHVFIFLFPLHRYVYIGLFVFVNCWSILIHDSDMITGHPLEKVINGPAHHTLHHLYFTVNYGQYFTWADRVGGSYRQPESSLDPLLEVKDEKEALGKEL